MDFSIVLSFILLAAPAGLTPGPNNLMVMASAAKFGMLKSVPHAVGIILGFPFMVFVVGIGLGEIFTAYPLIKVVMKYVAVVYFLWMAWHLLGFKIGDAQKSERPLRFTEAALFQWINPKAWAMATSFVSAFVISGPNRFYSIGLLSLGCLILTIASCTLWMLGGQQLRAFLTYTKSERLLGVAMATLMLMAILLFVF